MSSRDLPTKDPQDPSLLKDCLNSQHVRISCYYGGTPDSPQVSFDPLPEDLLNDEVVSQGDDVIWTENWVLVKIHYDGGHGTWWEARPKDPREEYDKAVFAG